MRITHLILIQGLLMLMAGFISPSFTDGPGDGIEPAEISAEEFLGLETSEDIIILDVRTPAEYESGHLENALLINIKSDKAYDKIDKLDKNKTYYVYCRSGKRSNRAVNYMRQNGFDKSFNISGGLLKLRKEGVDLVR